MRFIIIPILSMFFINGRDVASNVRTEERRRKREQGVNLEKKWEITEITL